MQVLQSGVYGGIYTFLWDSTPIYLNILADTRHITHITWHGACSIGSINTQAESNKSALSDECAKEIQAYFDRRLFDFSLPLSPKGSAFQQSVWEALRQIPYGQTRSYKDIARAIGKIQASRAIGNANGANPLMILIPCHRVVRENGDLGGYAYGTNIKAKLLALEAEAQSKPKC